MKRFLQNKAPVILPAIFALFACLLSASSLTSMNEYLIDASTGIKGWKIRRNIGNSAPQIDLWYGTHQRFGHLGMAQHWVNILGNISGPHDIASVGFSLNNGQEMDLALGPDGRRLAAAGDFNVEIHKDALRSGLNEVAIKGGNKESKSSLSA